MKEIWYLLKCPEGDEASYAERCRKFVASEELKEIVWFQYQRMMRYGGKWHLEKRTLLPGCLFLLGTKMMVSRKNYEELKETGGVSPVSLVPCKIPYVRELCQDGNLVSMSKGFIWNGKTIVTSGPLKGREELIQKIDRHKRTAQIEILLEGEKKQVTVGLEIYEKQIQKENKK